MMACPRWAWSAATVSRCSVGAVVKNAWKRHTSNRVPCPAAFFFCGVHVGDAAHDQPARDPVGLLLGGERGVRDLGDLRLGDPRARGLVEDRVRVLDRAVHALSSMPAIAALTAWSIRTVTDTCAPPVSAAWTGVAAVVGRVHPDQDPLLLTEQAAGLLHGVTDQTFRAAGRAAGDPCAAAAPRPAAPTRPSSRWQGARSGRGPGCSRTRRPAWRGRGPR
jgi:hypothetical protein